MTKFILFNRMQHHLITATLILSVIRFLGSEWARDAQ
jgi:hypothetical protein